MSNKKAQKLSVIITGTRCYIDVPSVRGSALLKLLRDHGVQASPPEPISTGTDAIELRHGTDVKVVQALLDNWA